jgi:hypothetical protein
MFDTRFEWHGEEAMAQVKALTFERLKRAVVFFHTEVLAALNKSNPRPYTTPSKPGEPPRKRTGWLQRNVLYELDEKALEGRVGLTPNAKYGLFLEVGTKRMAARPWLFATLKRLWNKIKAIAEGS